MQDRQVLTLDEAAIAAHAPELTPEIWPRAEAMESGCRPRGDMFADGSMDRTAFDFGAVHLSGVAQAIPCGRRICGGQFQIINYNGIVRVRIYGGVVHIRIYGGVVSLNIVSLFDYYQE